MRTLMMLMALNCPPTKIVNMSNTPWTETDDKIVMQCQRRCGEIYPRSPCLKRFTKKAKQDYTVVCGSEFSTE